jgi:hypothetical protein
MPYDKKGEWTPDPKYAGWADPGSSKYIDENGNDPRYGQYIDGVFWPDFPEIVELKKSGRWAQIPPLNRRWFHSDCWSAHLTPEMQDEFDAIIDDVRKIQKDFDERNKHSKERQK